MALCWHASKGPDAGLYALGTVAYDIPEQQQQSSSWGRDATDFCPEEMQKKGKPELLVLLMFSSYR
ncbi:uncharacterized protein TrAtP1_001588 [Trichoderma atroviride]|uniref:Uncharacterized protein n=1 Tax=Hypocrea atroviridis (strain ATCC 20476 / IMI 206040) TaxID=452589 RepID=G9P0Q7_HYPAI|nr:uncharacterized protein TRIATDRAFT_310758 [Trichoderma atroviride IMI 206040]EHK43208.1 hypothetical protein TRIATDRAFT_310758 [Trichoderma atroviride IMI 206040]UKZ60308.1 hypothetical protein TrAtP1_001588 [Trichoderma atroviride]